MSQKTDDVGPNTVQGLPPVVGVLLMVLITVILGAVLGTFLVV